MFTKREDNNRRIFKISLFETLGPSRNSSGRFTETKHIYKDKKKKTKSKARQRHCGCLSLRRLHLLELLSFGYLECDVLQFLMLFLLFRLLRLPRLLQSAVLHIHGLQLGTIVLSVKQHSNCRFRRRRRALFFVPWDISSQRSKSFTKRDGSVKSLTSRFRNDKLVNGWLTRRWNVL